MGTSQSSKGTKGKNPLIPSWADGSPGQAPQEPTPNRHTPFRTALGQAASGGGRQSTRSALGHYARSTSGGANAAVRRLGSVIQTGGNLINVLRNDGSTPQPVNIANLSGMPCDQVISVITQALTPQNGDGDKIRTAMNNALVEALDGVDTFNPNEISDDILVDTLINYLSESIFIHIAMEGADSWNNAETVEQQIQAETDLRELIETVVDIHLSPKISSGIRSLNTEELMECEKQAISDIWSEWEGYQ